MPDPKDFPKRKSTRPELTTVQRARICVFESETEFVMISAAVVATVIARVEGDRPVDIAPGTPVFWLSESERMEVLGDRTWDVFLHRIGYDLLSIPFEEWCTARVLSVLQRGFPKIEIVNPDDTDGSP